MLRKNQVTWDLEDLSLFIYLLKYVCMSQRAWFSRVGRASSSKKPSSFPPLIQCSVFLKTKSWICCCTVSVSASYQPWMLKDLLRDQLAPLREVFQYRQKLVDSCLSLGINSTFGYNPVQNSICVSFHKSFILN